MSVSLTERSRRLCMFALVVGLGVAVQAWAALQWTANFDSDEAIIGLMSRHILQGKIPAYFYGQSYLGSLDAIISSVFIRWIGNSVPALRIGSVLLFGAFLVLHGVFVSRLWGRRVALISLLVLALPGWGILSYTYRPNVAFGLMSVLGTTALLLFHASRSAQGLLGYVYALSLGIIVGLGLWTHPMTGVYFLSITLVYWLKTPEWSTLYERLSHRCERMGLVSATVLVLLSGATLMGLTVIAFFAAGCEPQASFAMARTIARTLLLAVGAGLGVAALLVSTRRGRILLGGLSLASGFALGVSPQWATWLYRGEAPSLALLPSCPTGTLARARLVVERLVPATVGMPPVTNILGASPLQVIRFAFVSLVALAALGLFAWGERAALRTALTLSPLSRHGSRAVILAVLLALPLCLAILSSNTVDFWSVRYLLVSWQASSIVLAVFLSRLATRLREASLLLLGLWVVLVGLGNLTRIDRRWDKRRDHYSPEAVAILEEYLMQKGVHGGYTDYWIAYVLDFLTEERLIFVPYNGNGSDRYPAYSEQVESLPVQAYLFPPGIISPQASKADDIVGELGDGEPGARLDPRLADRLGGQVVLERQRVANWDVWLLSDWPP